MGTDLVKKESDRVVKTAHFLLFSLLDVKRNQGTDCDRSVLSVMRNVSGGAP